MRPQHLASSLLSLLLSAFCMLIASADCRYEEAKRPTESSASLLLVLPLSGGWRHRGHHGLASDTPTSSSPYDGATNSLPRHTSPHRLTSHLPAYSLPSDFPADGLAYDPSPYSAARDLFAGGASHSLSSGCHENSPYLE